MDTARLIPQEEKELREKNLEIIRRYMSYAGAERRDRIDIYTDDHRGGLYCWETGVIPEPVPGKERKAGFDRKNVRFFPDWAHSDNELYQTSDPNVFLTTCRGFGNFMNPIYGCPYYENFFIGSFIVEDGKIKEYYEYMNPCAMVLQFGMEVPKIKRPKRVYTWKAGENNEI